MSCELTPVCCRAELEAARAEIARLIAERKTLDDYILGQGAEIAALKRERDVAIEATLATSGRVAFQAKIADAALNQRDALKAALETIAALRYHPGHATMVAREALAKLPGKEAGK